MEFESFDGEMVSESSFGPEVNLEATVSFDPAQLSQFIEKKRNYLEAAEQDTVAEEKIIEEVAKDLAAGADIVFNRIGSDYPAEGLYQRVNDAQWKQLSTEDYYKRYSDLLWDISDEFDAEVPSIPALHRPFLLAVAESNEHELPPEGVVDDILREHIESVRNETQSREGVSKLKQELEKHGVNARTAASVAKSMEDYIKTDAEVNHETRDD